LHFSQSPYYIKSIFGSAGRFFGSAGEFFGSAGGFFASG